MKRLHGGFLSEKEIERTVDFIKKQDVFDFKNEISLDEDIFNDSLSLNFDNNNDEFIQKLLILLLINKKYQLVLFKDTFKLVITEQPELWKKWRTMVLFQKQITQAKDKYLKKQINLNILGLFFLVILFSKSLFGEELNSKIIKYLQGLKSFSSSFIQSDGTNLEQGYIYIKDNKIRLDYINPDRTLKISKEKGVYINHELREEEFFSTKKNIIKIFYDIFLKKIFLFINA